MKGILPKIWFITNFFIVFITVKFITAFNLLVVKKEKKKCKKVLYLALFEEENAGNYFRVKLWREMLEENDFDVTTLTLMNTNQDLVLLTSGNITVLIKQMYKRLSQCLKAYKYDIVIVRRTLLPFNDYGNLFFEKLILSINRNSILDFDDDMHNYNSSENQKTLFGKLLLENKEKFRSSLTLYNRFIVGSNYLKELTLKHHSLNETNICVIPTCVDYNKHQPKRYTEKPSLHKIGWVGTKGNQKYLDKIIPVLNKLNPLYNFEFIVISDQNYINQYATFNIINRKWSREKEIELIKSFDIGIMPLSNNPTTKGKCGFKLIQYMGLGIVSIAEKVGANHDIISDKKYGFLCDSDYEWESAFIKIFNMTSDELKEMSENSKKWIDLNYTFDSNELKYTSFLKNLNN